MGTGRALPARAPSFGLLVVALSVALHGNEAREVHILRGHRSLLLSGQRLAAWEEPVAAPSAPAAPVASPTITAVEAADIRAEVDAATADISANYSVPVAGGSDTTDAAGTPAPAPLQAQPQAPAQAPSEEFVLPGGGQYNGYHQSSSAVDDLLIVARANRAEEEQRCAVLKQSQQEAILETNRRIRELAAETAAAPERLMAVQTEIEFITMELRRSQDDLSNHDKRCVSDGLLFESQLKNVARHKAIMERLLERADCSSGAEIPNCEYLRDHLQSLRTGVDAKKAELELQLNESRANCTTDRARREGEIERLEAGLEEQRAQIEVLTGASQAVDRRDALNDEMREHHEEYGTTLQGCMQRVGAYDEEIASLEMLKSDLDRLVPHTAATPPPLQAAGQQQAAPSPPPAVEVGTAVAIDPPPVPATEAAPSPPPAVEVGTAVATEPPPVPATEAR